MLGKKNYIMMTRKVHKFEACDALLVLGKWFAMISASVATVFRVVMIPTVIRLTVWVLITVSAT